MINTVLNFFRPKKKKPKRLTYEDYIIANACDNNINLTTVNNIEIVKTFPLEEGLYGEVSALIKAGEIESIRNMPVDEDLLGDLALVRFTNETGDGYAAIIYDSYESWQEPVVIEVFELGKH